MFTIISSIGTRRERIDPDSGIEAQQEQGERRLSAAVTPIRTPLTGVKLNSRTG